MPESHQLHRELWTSWASCLRSYAALHGLTSAHHAVVEVGAEEIILRVDTRWLRFTRRTMQQSGATPAPFSLNDDGSVLFGRETQPMDLAAEHFARVLLHPA
jgi:hypothetical protein